MEASLALNHSNHLHAAQDRDARLVIIALGALIAAAAPRVYAQQAVHKSAPCAGSLEEALAALEVDQAFLRKGDVFTGDVIDTWIAWKRKHEIDEVRMRPQPWEFHLYFDT